MHDQKTPVPHPAAPDGPLPPRDHRLRRGHECLAYTEVFVAGRWWQLDCARRTGRRGRHLGPHRTAAGRWFRARGRFTNTTA